MPGIATNVEIGGNSSSNNAMCLRSWERLEASFETLIGWAIIATFLTKAPIFSLGRLLVHLVVVAQNIDNEVVPHHLFHHDPYKSGARNSAFYCCLLEIIGLQRNYDIFDSQRTSPRMFRCPISFGQTVWRELAVIVARAVPYGVILCHSPLAWRKCNDIETNDPRGLRPTELSSRI